jgi:hypothetical protein
VRSAILRQFIVPVPSVTRRRDGFVPPRYSSAFRMKASNAGSFNALGLSG